MSTPNVDNCEPLCGRCNLLKSNTYTLLGLRRQNHRLANDGRLNCWMDH
ncbi:MAG: hypothetical protein OXG44_20220 [Gammaproteobacteria bacterium]|nr:hypothetical protein [Gammaproteobacteria bacterium]